MVRSAIILLLCCLTGAAHAECMPISKFAKMLLQNYREEPVVHAMQENMPLIIFVSPGGATYTMVIIIKPGVACALSAGRNWVSAKTPINERPS